MNNIIFSNDASQLQAAVYGINGTNVRPIAVDTSGQAIITSTFTTSITAVDFDIRNLSLAGDSALVTANNLDIRNLSGTQDSVKLYNRASVDDTESGTIVALGSRNFLTKNISMYRKNSYVVINQGGVAVTINLQIAPIDNDSYYINDGSDFNLLVGGRATFVPSKLTKYARIRVSAVLLGSVTVYYFGQA